VQREDERARWGVRLGEQPGQGNAAAGQGDALNLDVSLLGEGLQLDNLAIHPDRRYVRHITAHHGTSRHITAHQRRGEER